MPTLNKSLAFATILMTTSAYADAPCNYTNNDKVTFQGQIESIKIMKRSVSPYIDDTRKCIVNIRAKIKDEWYPAVGEFTFSPDMTENDACNHAEHRAKVKVLNDKIPIILESEKNIKCSLTKPKQSCKFIYMNVIMKDLGQQKVRMLNCEKK